MCLCQTCHHWVHIINPKVAKQLGYLVNAASIRPIQDLPTSKEAVAIYAASEKLSHDRDHQEISEPPAENE
jgi:hypothetical protein